MSGTSDQDPWTIQRILFWSTNFLKDKQFETPRLDAELLLSHALGLSRIQLYTHFDKPLTAEEREPFKALLRRRTAGEPIAYITGTKDFMGYTFEVSSAGLIPRPDTEVLVETALARAKAKGEGVRILDVGTGTGCIALSLAKKLSTAQVVAWDVADETLELARRNAAKLAVENVAFAKVDALSEEAWTPGEAAFDLIVSNPPYIGEAERVSLMVSVKSYEPARALFAAEEGYAFYRVFAERAAELLKPDGSLLVEIGCAQADGVRSLLEANGWRNVTVQKDYGKLDRVVAAEPPSRQ